MFMLIKCLASCPFIRRISYRKQIIFKAGRDVAETFGNILQWKDIFWKLESKYTPKPYTDGTFNVILCKKLGELCELGLLEGDYRGPKQSFYRIPSEYLRQIKLRLQKRNAAERFTNLPLDYQLKVLDEYEYYGRKEQIIRLKKLPLPAQPIRSKIHEAGFECSEFKPETWSNIYFDNMVEDEELGDEVEIKIVPEEDLKGNNSGKRAEIDMLMPLGWRQMAISPSGHLLFCRYKVFGQMVEEQFEAELRQWKEQLGVSDEEWEKIKPELRQNPPEELIKRMWGVDR
jgi:hypothetical protein